MTDELQNLSDKLAAINAEAAQLQAKFAEQTAAERADALADIKQDIAEFGIKPAELFSAGELRKPEKSAKPAKAQVKIARPPKYRSAQGQTWSGAGRRPAWVNTALASGASLDDLRVAA